ncbi:hypothetical protein VMT65_18490 [Nocardia sp. CDC153]|uniref:hypothetical protein n=1 Tax=Nocardia sp. CDC153 TaxID=3112167 RepID=UPI002DBACBEE|nr:hypothetical protein [Nocardia sp. CDC153]MEC3955036.1 hypothetical protein [Nocardia sp. CDC153]
MYDWKTNPQLCIAWRFIGDDRRAVFVIDGRKYATYQEFRSVVLEAFDWIESISMAGEFETSPVGINEAPLRLPSWEEYRDEHRSGRRGRPGRQQLMRNFENMLGRALEGHGVRTHSGLDQETRDALRVVAQAHPNVSDELVEDARRAFAGQLDGSNAARRRAEHERKVRERAARRRP